MPLKAFGSLLVLALCLRRTVCFPYSSSPAHHFPIENDDGDNDKNHGHKTKIIRIESVNKYGGSKKYFDFAVEENPNDGGSGVTGSRFKHSGFGVTAIRRRAVLALRTTFLPVGFPNRTPHGYLQFCVWSWIQDVSTQLRSVLATQKILEGVGVGREGATALSALFNYLVRDGCGMAANLLFTYAASSRFRSDVKKWRIFADVSVDIGITLEVAATLFPSPLFLPCICVGNMFKAICGVAAGACGGSINLYWAKGSDISDINAKFGAQHTVTGAIGLVFAGLFAKSVNTVSPHSLWLMFFCLTFLHLYGNVRCMRLISFDYLNTSRLDMILRSYITRDDGNQARIPTPQEIAKREPLWLQLPGFDRILMRGKKPPPIYFGVAFDEFCKRSGKPVGALKTEISDEAVNGNDGYVVSIGYQNISPARNTDKAKPCVVVSMFSDVSSEQQTRAYVHAWLLANSLQERQNKEENNNNWYAMDLKGQLEIEAKSKLLLKSIWGEFTLNCTNAGWDLSQSELQTCGYEMAIA